MAKRLQSLSDKRRRKVCGLILPPKARLTWLERIVLWWKLKWI